jgi:cytochrome c biogenesis protein
MRDFTEVKASVFQVTRSPGQATVYLGSLLLVLGIFGMLYVQERRVWVWASDGQATGGGMRLRMAASSPRSSMDFDREFSELKGVLEQAPSRKPS